MPRYGASHAPCPCGRGPCRRAGPRHRRLHCRHPSRRRGPGSATAAPPRSRRARAGACACAARRRSATPSPPRRRRGRAGSCCSPAPAACSPPSHLAQGLCMQTVSAEAGAACAASAQAGGISPPPGGGAVVVVASHGLRRSSATSTARAIDSLRPSERQSRPTCAKQREREREREPCVAGWVVGWVGDKAPGGSREEGEDRPEERKVGPCCARPGSQNSQ